MYSENRISQLRDQVNSTISALDKSLAIDEGVIKEKKANLDKYKKKQVEHKRRYKILEKTLDVLRMYAKIKEQALREKIDDVVTQGMRLIFGNTYTSKMEFKISRGQAVLIPKIISEFQGEQIETPIEDSRGGGVANVASVIYQILVLSLYEPRQSKILIADEPFRNLSQEHLEAAGEFLKILSEKLNIQIVLVTHRKELEAVADRLYKFSNKDGVTQVEKIF